MKTVREWLKTLPEPYRRQALMNLSPINADYLRSTLWGAISGAFFWRHTPEGCDYWSDLEFKIRKGYDIKEPNG